MDSVHGVLSSFGVPDLPSPSQYWQPNEWFLRLPGHHYLIDVDFYWHGHPFIKSLLSKVRHVRAEASNVLDALSVSPTSVERAKFILKTIDHIEELASRYAWSEVIATEQVLRAVFGDV